MSGSHTVPVVIVNADHGAPWELLALASVLLPLAYALRHVPWARWTLTTLGTLTLIGAALLLTAAT
ncbi:hypothetical protein [Deinococcus soli (ex Cha et al. 2016)]|uniref:Uncharacterized protein n=1 Tax=Deinococcus soli (ex Cha et al. 2016) TaxID=1309411 RepID=A0ACC6KP23_9DEIO|nr:hypothetical protein [Deinococcus soli (ex Cha et al. 2016)]MDR6330561.1 hypothetical protein [Deinococcus soli (ex Cha et al. 2016)]MDR6754338.1 hypothetical protein [Deinococcus soli (ex Cha et al. 2016)]GGB84889.1 hypothetical protein GCM10008019_46080 [Deinococcus soli (ex Cha et al. 2016)]